MSRQTTLWSLLLLYVTILDIKNVNILIKRMFDEFFNSKLFSVITALSCMLL